MSYLYDDLVKNLKMGEKVTGEEINNKIKYYKNNIELIDEAIKKACSEFVKELEIEKKKIGLLLEIEIGKFYIIYMKILYKQG